MINYVVYDTSGHIIRCGTCPDDVSQIQNENEFQLNVDWPSDIENYVVLNGILSRKPESEILAYQNSQSLDALRASRAVKLKSSDWTQLSDNGLSDEKKAEWRTYRQQLRDLPSTVTDYDHVSWPSPPS